VFLRACLRQLCVALTAGVEDARVSMVSRASDFDTGQVLYLDGGITATQ
jgi:hypothetical protein